MEKRKSAIGKRTENVHARKVHEISGRRRVLGVSHSWAGAVDLELAQSLDASPDLRHVCIRVPKEGGDVLRLFHSRDGITWFQVHPKDWTPRGLNIRAVARGARELDGDPSFDASLSTAGLHLREMAGNMLVPVDMAPLAPVGGYGSLAEWVEARIRPALDAAGDRYVDGARSEEARNGRRQGLLTIERLIRHLRHVLHRDEPYATSVEAASIHDPEYALKAFLIRRHTPFLTQPEELLFPFERIAKSRQKKFAAHVWADAARMPHDSRFSTIYGALLRQAEGHPVFGDEDYRRLEDLLRQDLEAGYRVVALDGCLFVRSRGRWRPARVAPHGAQRPDWSTGMIVSRNHGRVIVPPFMRDGETAPGYTRNGPGEGPAEPRDAPLEMRCVDRPVAGTNLNWIHAYHAWEMGRD